MKETIPTIEERISFHRKEAERTGGLMYDNPGKYSRYYLQPVPRGFEEEVKSLKKLRDFHKRMYDKLVDELENK